MIVSPRSKRIAIVVFLFLAVGAFCLVFGGCATGPTLPPLPPVPGPEMWNAHAPDGGAVDAYPTQCAR